MVNTKGMVRFTNNVLIILSFEVVKQLVVSYRIKFWQEQETEAQPYKCIVRSMKNGVS